YLLTNPCTNMIGVYRIVKKQMAFDLGYSIESINSLMDRFINYHKLIKYNENTKELCIVHYGKYNLNRGGKPMLDCIKKDLSKINDISLIEEIVVHIKHPAIKSFIEDYLSKLNNDTSDDTSTTSEREADKTINHNPKTINHNPKTINHNPKTINHNPKSKTTTTIDNSSSLKGNLDVFKHFEKCGFMVAAMLMEQIASDIEIYNKQWLMDAATEAMNRGKINNYKYVLGILQNWTSNGRKDINGNTSNNKQDLGAELREQGIGL
ncbi:MAG: hypothetical protein E7G24_06295, partial [Clostridium celatum]|nr:hypothetical protein [Clostridium celatum]